MERNDARTSNGVAGGAVSDDAANAKTKGGDDDERAPANGMMQRQFAVPATISLGRGGGSKMGMDVSNRRSGPLKAPGDDASALMPNWAASVAFARADRGGEWRSEGDAAVRKKIIAEM